MVSKRGSPRAIRPMGLGLNSNAGEYSFQLLVSAELVLLFFKKVKLNKIRANSSDLVLLGFLLRNSANMFFRGPTLQPRLLPVSFRLVSLVPIFEQYFV